MIGEDKVLHCGGGLSTRPEGWGVVSKEFVVVVAVLLFFKGFVCPTAP